MEGDTIPDIFSVDLHLLNDEPHPYKQVRLPKGNPVLFSFLAEATPPISLDILDIELEAPYNNKYNQPK